MCCVLQYSVQCAVLSVEVEGREERVGEERERSKFIYYRSLGLEQKFLFGTTLYTVLDTEMAQAKSTYRLYYSISWLQSPSKFFLPRKR